ncbi:hypothetical protein CWI39_0085p0050 [Hamiltosporidium magnivora]|uniref:J domain-containing protein n=1 Tax=Hamiltosporidium magnivora TaxID=148818 RepID=A0A4Q9LLU8_9MICR|nr:hypothetical protein CWI39_0085p0050 [Hamiltosporidium magnivora]
MLYFLYFISSTTYCLEDNYGFVLKSIERLQNKTNFKTFYEMFGVSENASFRSIRKRYAKMMKNENPFPKLKMSKFESDHILTEGYNIIKTKRIFYDGILNNAIFSKPIKESKRFTMISGIIMGIIFLIILDFFILILKENMKSNRKLTKKEKRIERISNKPDFADLYLLKSYNKIRNFLKK